MKDWIDLLANANNSIFDMWAIFITVNTATIGWVLSKKTSFSKHHVFFAIFGYIAFTTSISIMLEKRYTYRNVILLDLQAQFIEKGAKENEEAKENIGYPFYIKINGKHVQSNVSEYISEKSDRYQREMYFWLIINLVFISIMFYLDGQGQFHPKQNEDNKANPADANKGRS